MKQIIKSQNFTGQVMTNNFLGLPTIEASMDNFNTHKLANSPDRKMKSIDTEIAALLDNQCFKSPERTNARPKSASP